MTYASNLKTLCVYRTRSPPCSERNEQGALSNEHLFLPLFRSLLRFTDVIKKESQPPSSIFSLLAPIIGMEQKEYAVCNTQEQKLAISTLPLAWYSWWERRPSLHACNFRARFTFISEKERTDRNKFRALLYTYQMKYNCDNSFLTVCDCEIGDISRSKDIPSRAWGKNNFFARSHLSCARFIFRS